MVAENHSESVGSIYTQRATEYDNSHHVQLAEDFVKWADLKLGSSVLDLAAGTGLVTNLAKKAVGPSGRVVGVDVSAGMLAEAKRKSDAEGLSIDWLLGDISMDKDSKLRKDVAELSPQLGFNTITCCSALLLLEDPAKAVSQWVEMLAPGGQLLVDTPHDTSTKVPQVLYQLADEGLLSSWLLHGLKHRMPDEKQMREWLRQAGLRAESWVTGSYVQKEITDLEKFWEEVRASVSWDVQIKDGIDPEIVKSRFIELLRSMEPEADKIIEYAQIIVARGWKPMA